MADRSCSLIDTLRPIQNTSGGFGGGQGQYSHLATTYAAVLSIAVVGGEEAYALLHREAMLVLFPYAWSPHGSRLLIKVQMALAWQAEAAWRRICYL